MPKFRVSFSVAASVVVEAESNTQAREIVLSSDDLSSKELMSAIAGSIEEAGNEAITIDDVEKEEKE